MFKLPITYRKHYPVPITMIKDLELKDTVDTGLSMYDRLFDPKTELAKATARQWDVFTDDTSFLEETVRLVRETEMPVHAPDEFLECWRRVQDTADFTTVFQFIEQKQLEILNTSSKFLCALSVYSMTSPLLFIISPLIMLLIPFVMLKAKNMPVTWSEYRILLMGILKNHAIGGLVTGFAGASINQKMYLVVVAVFFGIQMYSNVQTCFTFFKNIRYVHLTLNRAKSYADHILKTVDAFKEIIVKGLPTYEHFTIDMNEHAQVLRDYHTQLCAVRPGSLTWGEVAQMGNVRQLFYRLKTDVKLKNAFEYSFGLHGFAENISMLKTKLGNDVNACTFGNETKFSKAVYVGTKHRPNSYVVSNCAITGPNAAGKTTFIKTTMLNVLFSQQFGMGYYKTATVNPYQALCCYLNIPDTSGRDSLFQAEARRCKEIINSIQETRILCIFDELFSGTNPAEASASAYAFLLYLVSKPQCTFLLTTHFLDVCSKIEGTSIKNMNMKTQGMGESLKYLYKFSKGISRVKGGVQVLQDLGYPTSIVECAKAWR